MTALQAGTPAPDFALPSTPDQKVMLSELRGRPVVLVFYPADWSPVCSDQLGLYNELLPEFSEYNAQLVGISCDGIWCHLAFSKDRKLRIPLLADFEPKGDAARAYGVYSEKDGEAQRALFVIDADGVIRWSYVSPVGINPGADGILKALDALKQREAEISRQNYKMSDAAQLNPPVSARDHAEGPGDAPLTLVEYGDYQCPYCRLAYPVVKRLQKKLGAKLRFVFRNFPLTQAHPYAEMAAEVAEAAALLDTFWPMHDIIYENQEMLSEDALIGWARELGLDDAKLAAALKRPEIGKRIKEDRMSGIRSGINGTPTFFINGARHDGAPDYATLLAALEAQF